METRNFIQRKLRDFGYGTETMENGILEQIPSFLKGFEEQAKNEETSIHDLGFNTFTIKYLWSILLGQSENLDLNKICTEFHDAVALVSKLPATTLFGMLIPKLEQYFPSIFDFKRARNEIHKFLEYFAEHVKVQDDCRVKGSPFNMAQALLDKQEDDESPQMRENKWYVPVCIGELVIAGIDSSALMLEWLLYFLVKYPEIGQKLRAEVDQVLGSERTPSAGDRSKMIYVEAFIQEVLRKASVVPLGVFRAALEDTELCGCFIPKGTMIITNLYAVHHDEAVWGDPDEFRPERFLDTNKNRLKSIPELMPFGVGRRFCIGDNLARNQMFLCFVSILQKFGIKAVGKLPSEDGSYGFTLSAQPFKIKVSDNNMSL